MTKNVTRRILLLIALYVCIIFGIFAVQFTKGTLFSRTIGDLVVTAAQASDDAGSAIPVLPVHASAYGVSFFLDESTSVLAYTSGNTPEELHVTEISSSGDTFVLSFSNDAEISIVPERRGDIHALKIQGVIPRGYRTLSIPFKLARSARIESGSPVPIIRTGKEQFSFSGNSFSYDRNDKVHRLEIDTSSPIVYYQTWLPAKGFDIKSLANNPGAGDSQFRLSRDRFASSALPLLRAALSSGSLNEKTVTAYLSEMGRIGMYQTALDAVPAHFKHSSVRTYLSCPFLNTLERSWPSMVALDREQRSILSRQFTENNPKAFEFPRLVPFLIDRGSTVFLDDIVRVASAIDLSQLSPLQAAGLMEIMKDMEVYSPDKAATLLLMAETCERVIQESLVSFQDKLYIASADGVADTASTLRIAAILRRYGARGGADERWRQAGNLLFTTLFSHSLDGALIPASFTASAANGSVSGPVSPAEKMMTVEDLYPLVMNESSWYPHSLSLARESGPGVWAWTVARSVAFSETPDGGVKYTVQFLQGKSHYMVLNGIEPFSRIQLYGMDFRTDPRFETYNSSGYRYDAATKTLYLKMRHRSEFEDVVIYRGEPVQDGEPVPESGDPDAAVPASGEEPSAPPSDSAESGADGE